MNDEKIKVTWSHNPTEGTVIGVFTTEPEQMKFIMDRNNEFVVRFRCEKSRGNNIPSVSYEYQKHDWMKYHDILASITKLDSQDIRKIDEKVVIDLLREQYESERLFVIEILKKGELIQSKILEEFKAGSHDVTAEFSRRTLESSLKKLDGIDWESKRGDKNARIYKLKTNNHCSYSMAKNGN